MSYWFNFLFTTKRRLAKQIIPYILVLDMRNITKRMILDFTVLTYSKVNKYLYNGSDTGRYSKFVVMFDKETAFSFVYDNITNKVKQIDINKAKIEDTIVYSEFGLLRTLMVKVDRVTRLDFMDVLDSLKNKDNIHGAL